MGDGIGLSIGTSALRAVAIDRSAVRRSPVLTLYPHRPAEVGVPSENPHLTERGLIVTDFVDRVGDPVPMIATDGSSHRAEALLADALRSLLDALLGQGPVTEPVGVTHPAHWRPGAVDALRVELARRPGFGGSRPVPMTSDAVAALTALQDDPGVPARGVVVLCDVGASGASITLADAATGFQPIGATVRSTDFSGDLVDQALVRRVVQDLAGSGSLDAESTSAIGNLTRLRGECRAAKERLSTSGVTSLPVELSGRSTEVRITRTELDDAIREPLGGFVDLIRETLQRSGIRSTDLAAVASVGGGARMPILTTMLSEHLLAPVITSVRGELAAAIGAGLKAARGSVPDAATAMAPVPTVDPVSPQSSTFRALAWSDADDLPEPVYHPASVEAYETHEPYQTSDARPRLAFTEAADEAEHAAAAVPWYRRAAGMVAVAGVAVLALLGGGAYYLLRSDDSTSGATPGATSTSASTTTASPETVAPQPSSEVPPPVTEAPEQTVYQQQPPPPPAVTLTEQPAPQSEAPPATTEPPPPATEAAPATTEPPSTTDAPPTTVTVTEPPSSSTQQPIIPTLPYRTIPGLPFVPAPIQPQSP